MSNSLTIIFLLCAASMVLAQTNLPYCVCSQQSLCLAAERLKEQACTTQCGSSFFTLPNVNTVAMVACQLQELNEMKKMNDCVDQIAGQRCVASRRRRDSNGQQGMDDMDMNGGDSDEDDEFKTGNTAFDQAFDKFYTCVGNCMTNGSAMGMTMPSTASNNNYNDDMEYGETMDEAEFVCAMKNNCRMKPQNLNMLQQAWTKCDSDFTKHCNCYTAAGVTGLNCNNRGSRRK